MESITCIFTNASECENTKTQHTNSEKKKSMSEKSIRKHINPPPPERIELLHEFCRRNQIMLMVLINKILSDKNLISIIQIVKQTIQFLLHLLLIQYLSMLLSIGMIGFMFKYSITI
eukprot:332769_1